MPDVNLLLRRAVEAQQAKRKAEGDLKAYRLRLAMAGGVIPNKNKMGAYEDQSRIAHGDLSEAVNRIVEMGLEVKDVERGLVDFPTLYRGETVYLCYLMGEKTIEFWHGVTEGFRGRKPIDEEFLANHAGDGIV